MERIRENCFSSADEIILAERRFEMTEDTTTTRTMALIKMNGALRRNFIGAP
jgi:hypothetical protein